jgi:hypothetical protein
VRNPIHTTQPTTITDLPALAPNDLGFFLDHQFLWLGDFFLDQSFNLDLGPMFLLVWRAIDPMLFGQ